ncbi:hypothetical protein [Bradyrhizobium yuanmingense]|uniref:hypothetical protein n=1 Tax=Bradyrhizobium yuanmingense TaxID=108015 RepID=UPI0012E3A241|nr:hypothetical protein [Bradyrhizobium yuanmingense]
MEVMTVRIKQRLYDALLWFCFASLAWAAPVEAQTSTTNTPRLTMQGPAEQGAAPVPRDALGKPCLDVEAAARAHVINSNMIDHVISLRNNCPRLIRAKVCYFNSDRCNDVIVQGYKRADTILGSMNGIKFFRYSILQK